MDQMDTVKKMEAEIEIHSTENNEITEQDEITTERSKAAGKNG